MICGWRNDENQRQMEIRISSGILSHLIDQIREKKSSDKERVNCVNNQIWEEHILVYSPAIDQYLVFVDTNDQTKAMCLSRLFADIYIFDSFSPSPSPSLCLSPSSGIKLALVKFSSYYSRLWYNVCSKIDLDRASLQSTNRKEEKA